MCEIRMMRIGVERSFAGPDLRTLECPKCELAYKALAEGPMKRRTKRAGSKANSAGASRAASVGGLVHFKLMSLVGTNRTN
jgi:hypothetical protein